MTDASAILALLLLPGVGSATVHRAIAAASALNLSLPEMLAKSPRTLARALPPGLQDVSLLTTRQCAAGHAQAHALLTSIKKAGAEAVTTTDPDWPPALARLGTAMPPIIFFKGDRALLTRQAAAVVGARDPSKGGGRLARDCALHFVDETICVVSGGARGVDTRAHLTAIDAGGETMVVLPQGLLTYDIPDPIMAAVEDGRALVVSQFRPDSPWETHGAVTRNATIAALARIVCVIEPRKTGGSIRTARVAIGLGKPVVAWCATTQVRRLLQTAGAGDLADPAGNLRREYLRELFCQNVQTVPVQPELL